MMSIIEENNIDKRNAGCGAFIGSRLYIWGGETEDPIELSDSESENPELSDSEEDEVTLTEPVSLPRAKDKHPFDVFDVINHTWSRQCTTGVEDDSIPAVGNGSTLTYHPGTNSLYLYGGWNDELFSSDVYKVCAAEWKWEKVTLQSPMQPSPRYLTAVLLHGDRICNFAGVGPPIIEGQDDGAEFIFYEAHGRRYTFGWNNEYYEYDIEQKQWEAPLSGRKVLRPPPCGGLIMTKFDPSRAVYFGGRRETGYTNDIYIFDLDKKEFQGPLKSPSTSGQVTPPLPVPRSFPTLTSLVDPDLVGQRLDDYGPIIKPKLLLMWGKKTERIITDEVWLLDPLSRVWTQLDLGGLKPRSWHIAQPYYCDSECRVVIFGGNVHVESPETGGDRVNTADLQILTFGIPSLRNLCISAVTKGIPSPSLLPSSIPPRLRQQVNSAFNTQNKHTLVKPRIISA